MMLLMLELISETHTALCHQAMLLQCITLINTNEEHFYLTFCKIARSFVIICMICSCFIKGEFALKSQMSLNDCLLAK